MKYIWKFIKWSLWLLGIFISFIANYLLYAYTLPHLKINNNFVEDKNGIEIYVKSNGVHTDILMPVKSAQMNWNEFLPVTDFEKADERFQYIAIGWGDKGFYLNTPEWKDLTANTAINAILGLGETAIHATYIYSKPKESEFCKSIFISVEQYELLIEHTKLSFDMNENKPIRIVHPGYSDYDCFYEAKGSYSLFNTCNVWTGNTLKRTGIKIGIWTPFESGIINNFND